MLEPPGDGGGDRTADLGVEAGVGTAWKEADAAPKPGRRRAVRPGWGRYPARVGVLLVLVAAVLGGAFTLVSHSDPGLRLGIFLLAGTAIAGLAVRARSTYLLIPVPALAYVVVACYAGLIHDHAVDTTRTALTLSAVQWIADGFVIMIAATGLAAAIAVGRWLLSLGKSR